MRQYLNILAIATLVACSGSGKDDATDTGGAGDDDDDANCENIVLSTFPAEGDSDVYYKTAVRFELSAEDTAAMIHVTDAAGAEVAGTSSVSGNTVSWMGSADLQPNAQYTATLMYECGEAPVNFTTSSTGAPVTDDLTGNVYNLDLTSGEWVEPAGVGDLISGLVGDVEVLISPTNVTDTQIEMLGALGDGTGNQDLCSPSIPFPAADWTNPFFQLQSDSLLLDVAGYQVTIDDLDLSGAFAPDGSRIQGAILRGAIDTRPLVELIAPGEGDDAVCALVAGFGVPCVDCSDGSGPYCLKVDVQNIEAAQVAGANPLVARTDAEIAKDPTCK